MESWQTRSGTFDGRGVQVTFAQHRFELCALRYPQILKKKKASWRIPGPFPHCREATEPIGHRKGIRWPLPHYRCTNRDA